MASITSYIHSKNFMIILGYNSNFCVLFQYVRPHFNKLAKFHSADDSTQQSCKYAGHSLLCTVELIKPFVDPLYKKSQSKSLTPSYSFLYKMYRTMTWIRQDDTSTYTRKRVCDERAAVYTSTRADTHTHII
jgi:hypothetical protein